MTKKVVLSSEAKADLTEIWHYIAEDNPEAADRVFAMLQESLRKLSHNPLLGVLREDLLTELRGLVVKNYIIFYRVKNEILVSRILHGARNLENIFDE